MKQYLNTLYVTTPESYLFKDGECVAIKQEGQVRGKIPVHTLGSLVLFGQVSCSPFLLGHCAENGVTVSWLTENGRFLAAMNGPVSGNVLLRREQYRQADDAAASARLARAFCIGKIVNSRTVLRRTARERPHPELTEAGNRLSQSLMRLKQDVPLDVVRGIEGEAANTYFGVFRHLVTEKSGKFTSMAGAGGRRGTKSTACCLSAIPCWRTISAVRLKPPVSTRPSVSCIETGREGRDWRST